MVEHVAGFFAPWIIYAVILGLHLILPARRVVGYVTDPRTGKPYEYRLNGVPVLIVMLVLWAVLGVTGTLSWDWLYLHRWSGLAGAFVLGVVFSIAVVLAAPPVGRSWLAEFYFGRWENRQFWNARVDAKMFLYLVGAVMLALNLLSFTAHHVILYGYDLAPGVLLYCGLFLWFVVDYLVFERVHLYTYDIFAERVGFKLGFGCLTFYPYFYPIGLWATAHMSDPGAPTWLLVLAAVVFFAGWALSRGANMQKFYFKTSPERVFLGFLKPTALSNGERSLLCSGFWGVARHINYLGEILMAVGLTLALGRPGLWVPWLYPLYYIFLLVPRERADERRCAAKYGDLWQEYRRRVPRRIVPWLY
ncbi:MAG: ERG4/ERG24 family protein [Thermoleophilia bacterium]|nr:ERG4/ERG24 family protein [Thermoleophilia bacterium]